MARQLIAVVLAAALVAAALPNASAIAQLCNPDRKPAAPTTVKIARNEKVDKYSGEPVFRKPVWACA